MKNILLVALFSCTITLLIAQSASDEMAIRAFTREYMAAYNRQDIPALMTMQTTDALCILEGGDTIRGAVENAARFESSFTRYDATLLMRHINLSWSEDQQAWVAVGIYEGYGSTYVYDIPYHRFTAYANTMVQKDGRWKIARSVVTSLVRTLVYQEVNNFSEWSSVLRSFLHQTSMLTYEIGTLHNEPSTAYALFQWSSLEAAQDFFAGTGWQSTLQLVSAFETKPPVVLFLEDK